VVSIHSVFITGEEMFRHLQDEIITKWDLVRSSGKGCVSNAGITDEVYQDVSPMQV
jgi:hypothetical protein